MKPVSPKRKYFVLGLIFIPFSLAVYFLSKMEHRHFDVPILYPKEEVKEVNGEIIVDTVYHTVPEWSFINQDNEVYNSDSLKGKIYIADFFFTTCPSICPAMTVNMSQLYWKLDKKYYKEVQFVSYTVNPEYDTPEVLKKYAKDNAFSEERWNFLTGDKQKIYELGVHGYYLSTQEDVLAPGGFLHSEKFVLVDKEGRIRGVYNGTDDEEVGKLADDVAMLIAMYKREKRKSG